MNKARVKIHKPVQMKKASMTDMMLTLTDEDMRNILATLTKEELEIFELICKKQREICADQIGDPNVLYSQRIQRIHKFNKDKIMNAPSPFAKK